MSEVDSVTEQVLILTPTGRDSALIAEILQREGMHCRQCGSVDELAAAVEEGAAAALVAEEALIAVSLERLLEVLDRQPPWSDFPLLFLTSAGREASDTSTRLLEMFGSNANITILERPVRVPTFLSSIRSALRARHRQYQVRDSIRERARNEEKILQKQKLESLGVLAGGVAHDFNNLLTGILGNASLALDTVPPGSPAAGMMNDVVRASERAAHLTKQLLAYAGKGKFFVQSVDLSQVVREISQMIQSSLPQHAEVRLELAEELPPIQADVSQIQQLVMNLVINGAEAIPEGSRGSVLVTTQLQRVDEAYLSEISASREIAPGEYVALEVRDSGVGMTEETLRRIFDPFFTTKFAGRGLGLAATQGIVHGHKGLLKVFTAPGRGSTFRVLFPVAETNTRIIERPMNAPPKTGRGRGAVLVVDDEEVVRRAAKTALERSGYEILLAGSGAEGIQLFQELAGKISLVLLDLTMPGLGGEEVLRRIRAIAPAARVVLSSGYNEADAVRHFNGKGLSGFLQKPYTAAALLDIVARVLAEPL